MKTGYPAALLPVAAPRRSGASCPRACIQSWVLAILALALVMPAACAGSNAKVRTVEELRPALEQDRFVPKAFIKGDQARLYFFNAEQRLMFKADWDRARLRLQGFSSHVAEFRFDASPPPIETTRQKWREVKVLAYAEWHHFARTAAEALAPTEVGHGLYLQYALGDAVLFRNTTGEIKVERFASPPPGITIDRRLSREEVTAAVAGIIETNLLAVHPGESAFLLAPPPDAQRSRLVLIDLDERRVVVLLPPRTGDDPDGGLSVGSKVSSLASFVLVDNAWAVLKNPVSTVGRALNLGVQWPASLFGPRLRNKGSVVPPVASGPGMDLAAWENWLDTHTGSHRERGSLRLLIGGERFFPVFENRLATAAQRIDIHICIFDRDDVAVEIADRLKQESSNVPVRVIYDHNSTKASGKSPPTTPMPVGFTPPESIHRYLTTDSCVRVRPFLNPFLTSDHSKVLLIDRRFAYLGGMNFGREYRYEWHDMMVEIEGPVVASLQHEFAKNWAHAGALGDLAFAHRAVCGKPPSPVLTNRSDFVDLRRIYTKTGRRQIRHAELESINRAQNHIYLENPYLFDNAVIVALVRARLRGVDVRVVLPTGNDLSAGEGSNLVTANYLLRHGVRVYFYPGMTHVKALLADGWACFGSANFNTLSLRLNQETNLATSDPGFAGQFRRELFETDFMKSHELKEPISVGWSDHLADSILNQF